MATLFPYATMQSLQCLVADAVLGHHVTAVLEGHPALRRDWPWESDLPLRTGLYSDGDVEYPTEAWVVMTNADEGQPLVEASNTPNTLEVAGAA
eukprot:9767930-Prorocentrum_lima.AAC.1